ncbi:hypothetical protein GBF38_022560 [Nibea albiflora]|uniref:Uncharacterized protein n=1 Tax=Nibea albiflora TaxID=240163 RepID=A0ACB7FLR1_NIBAL|nr:hypothetical protein GBF38_022560 [Nibea albiflora]
MVDATLTYNLVNGVSVILPQCHAHLFSDYVTLCPRYDHRREYMCQLLSEVYRTVKHQIKAAVAALKDDLSRYRSDVEKLISAGLQPAGLLHDHITHTITEDLCEPMIQSLLHTVDPMIDRTLQEVATPACDGFASTWQYFLEMCDDIIELGSKSTSVTDIKKEVLTPLSAFGPGDARMWQCLDKLELNSEGQIWLQETWGVHSGTWRPLLLKAQNALFKVVHMCAVMFRRLVSRYPCSSFDSSQLTAVLCRVKERVVKDLSRYYEMVNSEQALFIHPDTIFPFILRDNLTSYIQSVMRHSLPQQFMPLPVSPRNPCSSSSSFSEPVYHNVTPGDCRCEQNVFQTPEGSTSGSETLTPSTMSDWDTDTLANSENSENRTLSQLDAGEYVCLNEA